MIITKNKLLKIILGITFVYVIVCLILFLFQEKFIFPGTTLNPNHTFNFETPFEEVNLEASSDIKINGLHFKTQNPKGAILFFHGNRGTLDKWGKGAAFYLDNGYDIFYIDYRGYGKSSGKIISEEQLFNDAQLSYDYLKSKFPEEQIIISGTSIGTGVATKLAAANHPKKLILHAPYSNLKKLLSQKTLIIPRFLMRYEFNTLHSLEKIKCNVHIFHGNADKVIPLKHSLELDDKIEQVDLIILDQMGHINFLGNEQYKSQMSQILI